MILIYSCVFVKHQYIRLLNLLLKSIKEFNNNENYNYLVITHERYEKRIRDVLKNNNIIRNDIMLLNIDNIFDACSSRLHIFNYKNINDYEKILYLDTDILITNDLDKIIDLELENKLYVLKEKYSREFHCCLFKGKDITEEIKDLTFTSGILLFNNNEIIKKLFSKILEEIKIYQRKKLKTPKCYDQPFFVYYGIKEDLIENKKLIGLCVNNPEEYKKEIITHFPEVVGNYKHKIEMMKQYYKKIEK